eukprot:NODE_7353_length_787_cov_2.811747_g6743_i0.p1 GENE.NODE_7353_length_787_cov_2.811747_g6743_i0~~NODE_7353_length_787_cov_2.811747_g6743_i0.p1  ORF type:complete len:167 (+),score=18.12 NODE_7353_length_787_cov_2.811747_g6743_i0:208-708(+)
MPEPSPEPEEDEDDPLTFQSLNHNYSFGIHSEGSTGSEVSDDVDGDDDVREPCIYYFTVGCTDPMCLQSHNEIHRNHFIEFINTTHRIQPISTIFYGGWKVFNTPVGMIIFDILRDRRFGEQQHRTNISGFRIINTLIDADMTCLLQPNYYLIEINHSHLLLASIT